MLLETSVVFTLGVVGAQVADLLGDAVPSSLKLLNRLRVTDLRINSSTLKLMKLPFIAAYDFFYRHREELWSRWIVPVEPDDSLVEEIGVGDQVQGGLQ